jgi:cell division septation protein DedD
VTELSHDGADDGFHEIQLSGKQLVALFMATTTVSVVIFLCGVLVGKNSRGDTLSAAPFAAEAAAAPPDSSPAASTSPPTDVPVQGGTGLTYPERLGDDKRVPETLRPVGEARQQAAAPPAPAAVDEDAGEKTAPPEKATPPPSAAAAPAPATAAPAARSGTWAVQVVALSDRSAANAVVKRLQGKGFPAFLVTPQAGAPVQMYKVQVGRYDDRSEAEQMKIRLKKEEQFEPIVSR